MPAVVPPSLEEEEEVQHTTVSAVQDYSMSKCSAGTSGGTPALHYTALHHGVLLPSFCVIDLHPSHWAGTDSQLDC